MRPPWWWDQRFTGVCGATCPGWLFRFLIYRPLAFVRVWSAIVVAYPYTCDLDPDATVTVFRSLLSASSSFESNVRGLLSRELETPGRGNPSPLFGCNYKPVITAPTHTVCGCAFQRSFSVRPKLLSRPSISPFIPSHAFHSQSTRVAPSECSRVPLLLAGLFPPWK